MALTPRKHGVSHVEVTLGAVALLVAATSIWGVVAVASDADDDVFPLGKPVLIEDVEARVADAGVQGTLARTLQAIADFGRSVGVVVRVAEGAGDDAAEIAADQAAKVVAGLEALRLAEQTTGVRPRILGAPGLDVQAVTAALGVVAPKLNAFAYARSIGETTAEVAAYRAGFSARELVLIDRDFLAFDAGAAAEVQSYAVARAIGLRAKLDREVGYHKTISNVPVPGVIGIDKPRSWDLQSADTEMGLINGADVTGLIQRQGFRFWGNRTCSSDPRFAFESVVRTNQVLRDTICDGLFPYIDQPLRNSLALDIVESINALFRREVAAGRLIGAEAFIAADNTAEQLAAGKLRIGYRFTPVAPLEELGISSEITDDFYADTFNLAA